LSENPLLPHRKLRELHALMLRCRELERKQKSRSVLREAMLAATSIHLLPGDLLSGGPEDMTAVQLAPAPNKQSHHSLVAPASLAERLPLCAAAARGLQASSDGVVLAFLRVGDQEPGWQDALEWAQKSQLPLLLACTDATDGKEPRSRKRTAAPLTFSSISRLAKRIKLPVLTMDGEDAVAVYRVMQESLIRARFGGGPAVLWGVLTPAVGGSSKLQRSKQPIARLESYLSARKIPLAG
jgi:TPP-dependent pyruvate/acetoin dehydrogenase alpha subunit